MSTRPALWRPLLPLVVLLLVLGALLLWLPRGLDGPPLRGEPLRTGRTADGPRFRRLPASETGLDFTNVLKPEHRFQYLTNGAGMAAGDFDGDGLVDLYLCCQDGPNKLFRQVAPMRFQDVTEKAGKVDGGQAWHTGATFVDVDGDGLLDLYVCCMEAPNKLYRNQGDGTFEECAHRFGLDFCGATMMAAFADYDRDGRLDCYLLTNRALHPDLALMPPAVLAGIRPPAETRRTKEQMLPDAKDPASLREHFWTFCDKVCTAGQPDHLLHNEGTRFSDVSERAGIRDQGMGLGVVWWDYDGDGWPDLYVANDLETPDRLYHNNRDGTFTDVTGDVLPHTAYYGMGCDAGDLDNDGRLDFLVADMSATTHQKAKILMGDMSAQRPFLVKARPPQYMRNALYHNTGTARFQELGFLAGVSSTDWTWSVLFGDLDNDGFQDIFATNGIPRFDMDPDVPIKEHQLWQSGHHAEADAVIMNVPKVDERHQALRNDGNLHFTRVGKEWGLDHEGVSHGAVLVDLDGDGDLDVVVNHWNEPAGIYENVGPKAHAIEVALLGRGGNRFGVGARVLVHCALGTLVRELFPAHGYLSGQAPLLHFGLGKCERIDRLEVRWPSGLLQEFRDLGVDRKFTIAEPGDGPRWTDVPLPKPGTVFERLAKGPEFTHREKDLGEWEYQREPLLPHGLSRLGPGVAIADVDGDGRDDLWIGGAAGQSGALLLHKQDGWHAIEHGPWEQDSECEDLGALFFDANGDGLPDLYVVSGGVEAEQGDPRQRDRLYLNQGGGHFVSAPAGTLPDLAESGSSVCAADFDRDGDLDLFVGGRCVPGKFPDAPPSRLLRNDGGKFTDVTAELAPALLTAGQVTGAVWTDVDGDGFPDLVIAAQWQPVRILHNDGGKRLVDVTKEAGLGDCLGWWNSVVALDVDGDGDMDLVVGNFGRNTKYKASPEHPAAIYFADFDGNGTRDLVEAKYEGDRLLPVRGRSCSSNAMPELAVKFPTYRSFASSALKDIYSDDKLDKAGVVKATCLDSVLLRNDGKGHFTIEVLPWLVQAAPVFGMAVADFDGDGTPDVVGAQNFFSPEPETGRMDGGLGFLLRSGTAWTEPRDSGIVAFGDGKGCACGDLDGDGRPDVVLAFSDGPIQCFRSQGPIPLQVRLHGKPGNPTAVGARVAVVYANGAQRVAEVTAGQGYLSQSSAALWYAPSLSGAAPVRVEVHWPDGTASRHEVPAGRMLVELAQQ